MTNLVTIPEIVYNRLMEIASKAGDEQVMQAAEALKVRTNSLESCPRDGTPVVFHTRMSLRFMPYKAKHRIAQGQTGRWQYFAEGQWVKLDHEPVGTWTPAP